MSILLGVVLGALIVCSLITFGAWMRAHRLLADADRARVVHLIDLVERLLSGAATDRVAVAGVADDLRKSHVEADATEGPHGAAADAGARTPPEDM